MRRFNCSLENRSNPSCKIYELFEFSYLFPVHWNTIFYLQYVMTIIVNHLRFSFSQMGNENNWLSKYNVVGSQFLSIENSHKFQQTVDKRPMITRLISFYPESEKPVRPPVSKLFSYFRVLFVISCIVYAYLPIYCRNRFIPSAISGFVACALSYLLQSIGGQLRALVINNLTKQITP